MSALVYVLSSSFGYDLLCYCLVRTCSRIYHLYYYLLEVQQGKDRGPLAFLRGAFFVFSARVPEKADHSLPRTVSTCVETSLSV